MGTTAFPVMLNLLLLQECLVPQGTGFFTLCHGGNHSVHWLRQIQERIAILGEKGWESHKLHTDFHGGSILYKASDYYHSSQTVVIIKVGKRQCNSEAALSVAKKIIPPPFLHD